MRQLVLVGHDNPFVGQFVGHLQVDMPAPGRHPEVPAPVGQRVAEAEARQRELHFAVLHLAEVEYLVHQLLQDVGVALCGLQQLPAFVGLWQLFQQPFYGPLDERERRAQLVAHVGEEGQLPACHVFHLAGEPLQFVVALPQLSVESFLGDVGPVHVDHDNHHENNESYKEQDDDFLVVVLREVAVYLPVQHVQVVVLAGQFAGLAQHHFSVVAGDDSGLQ